MTRERKIVLIAAIIISLMGIIIHIRGKVSAGLAEVYQVGPETVILGGEGRTMVGLYNDPTPPGPGVREIVLGYTCTGTNVLFQDILPSFAKYWYEQTGEKVRFVAGWNAIGLDSIATYVYDKPIQVLIQSSLANALTRGYSQTKWQKTKNRGILYNYPYVFVVRKGNPKNIVSYMDLARPDVDVVHIDPLGTHGGMSTIFSLYGAALKDSESVKGKKDYDFANQFLNDVEDKAITGFGGSSVRDVFIGKGIGDVAINIEPYARKMVETNPDLEIVVPPNTFTTEMAIYKMKKNIAKEDEELIDAFIDFLFTEQVQEAWASFGFRASDPDVMARHPEFPPIPGVFGIEYLGNQSKLKKNLILGQVIRIKNKNKRENEKIKVVKSPDNRLPDQSGLPIQQALPE